MDRREVLRAVGGAAFFVNMLPVEGHGEQQRLAHAAKHRALFEAANRCSKAAENCVCHCIEMTAAADKGMAECAASSREVLVVCNGLRALAAQDSAHLALYAKVAAQICKSCEAECRKHLQHPVCKVCGDACAACATECAKLA